MRHVCIILADSPGALAELCGISLVERLLRLLQRAGLTKAVLLSATPDVLAQRLANPSPHRAQVALDIRGRPGGGITVEQIAQAWPNDAQCVLVIPGDGVFDSRLLRLLDDQDAPSALVDSSPPANLLPLVASTPLTSRGRLCGAALVSRDWAATQTASFQAALQESVETGGLEGLDIASRSWHLAALCRELRPFWFPAPPLNLEKLAEGVLLDAGQKGALDLPALVHSPIENFLVSRLCKTPITPNQLTAFANLVAWSATILFATGQLPAGVALALGVGVLDGLDGKQARLKVETTDTGKLEHWFDALFENSWWIALAYHFQSSGELPGACKYLILLWVAEAVGGLAKWSIIRFRGQSLYELSNFDRFIRLIGARRNIHIWILALGLLLGAPARAFIAIAGWETITSAIQLSRAAWTLRFDSVARAETG